MINGKVIAKFRIQNYDKKNNKQNLNFSAILMDDSGEIRCTFFGDESKQFDTLKVSYLYII